MGGFSYERGSHEKDLDERNSHEMDLDECLLVRVFIHFSRVPCGQSPIFT